MTSTACNVLHSSAIIGSIYETLLSLDVHDGVRVTVETLLKGGGKVSIEHGEIPLVIHQFKISDVLLQRKRTGKLMIRVSKHAAIFASKLQAALAARIKSQEREQILMKQYFGPSA
jgi:hypothetical protein